MESCNTRGACEYQDKLNGASCNDGKFCTDPDTCMNRMCMGPDVLDGAEVSRTLTVDFVKLAQFVNDVTSILSNEPCDFGLGFSLALTSTVKEICCDSTMGAALAASGDLTGVLGGGSCTFKTPGGLPIGPGIVVKLLFSFGANAGVTAGAQISTCPEKDFGWIGQGFIRGAVGGGLSFEPIIDGRIIALKGVVAGGGGCDIEFKKLSALCTPVLAPITGSIELELLNGLISRTVSVVIYRFGPQATLVQSLPPLI
jgi:hypothetical protein